MNHDEPVEDGVVVLGPEPEHPARGPGAPRRWRPVALVLAVALVATVAWINRPRPEPRALVDPGSGPLYPGAEGRMLYTTGEGRAERLWVLDLESGAREPGPLLPPTLSRGGDPPLPGRPPDRRFALGPSGSPGGGLLAFLGRSELVGGRTFAYVLDVSDRGTLGSPQPAGEAHALAWTERGELLTARIAPEGDYRVDSIKADGVVEVARWSGYADDIAVTGPGFYLIEPELTTGDRDEAGESIVDVRGAFVRRVLSGWHVLGWGRNSRFLVEDPRTESAGPVHLWEPGGPPQTLPGFAPERILGWTADRQHYAAVGSFRAEHGLWFVSWPNTPVFLMASLHPGDESVTGVAFDGPARAAFFVRDEALWIVEIGSERVHRLPLTEDASRERPSGPLVWVP